MNERIKKLADQAYSYASAQTGEFSPEFMGSYDKKFAELVVKECAGINYKSSFKDGEFHAREVLEHFGVGE